MSTITSNWTEEKIRSIIRNLDRKTGLDGASLPIKFASHWYSIGYYNHGLEKHFGFKRSFFNSPSTNEAEVIDVIRHEYAHYYVDVVDGLTGQSHAGSPHGSFWKWACKMVGAVPNRCHNPQMFHDKNWSVEEAINAYNAADIEEFDIIAFYEKWNQLPLDDITAGKMLRCIKARNPDTYYEIGDEILHTKRGFGVVEDVIPHDYRTQKVFIRFEDQDYGVFDASDLCKIVDGVAIPFRMKSR